MGHHAEDAGRASMTSGDLMTPMASGSYTWEEDQLRSGQARWWKFRRRSQEKGAGNRKARLSAG